MKAFLRCVILLLSVVTLTAYPTGGGGTVFATKAGSGGYDDSVTWSVSPASQSGSTVTYNYSVSGWLNINGGASYSGGFIRVTGPGTTDTTYGGNDGAHSGTFTVTAGTDFHVEVKVCFGYRYQDIVGTADTISPPAEWDVNLTSNMTVYYKITVNIPANDTEGLIRYHIYQGETFLQEVVTEPGDGPQIIQFNDLTSNAPVTIKEMSYIKEIGEDPLNPGHYIVVSTVLNEIRIISTGTPTTGGTSASTPLAPKPSPTPIVKTTPAVAPAAPTPTAAPAPHVTHVTINAPSAPTLDTPSGTGGATKEDIETQTNKLVTAAHNTDVANTTAANAVVESLNSIGQTTQAGNAAVVDAVNKVAAASSAQATAIIGAQNGAQSSLDRINSTLTTLNTSALNSKATGDALYTAVAGGTDPGPASYAQTFTPVLAATDATPVTALVAKLPAVPNVLPTEIGTDPHFTFSLQFPPLTDTFNVSVDMSQYSTPIAVVRGLIKACLAILFFFLVVNTLKKAVA